MAQTLYERLGGTNAIAAVVDDFVARCAKDGRNGKFARSDIPPMQSYIVEIDSPETGAPLPERYQPAPPLG